MRNFGRIEESLDIATKKYIDELVAPILDRLNALENIAFPEPTLENILTPNNITPFNATDIQINGFRKPSQVVDDLSIPLELYQWDKNAGINIKGTDLEAEKFYTLAFKYEIKQGTVDNIHSTANLPWQKHKAYIDGALVSERSGGEVASANWSITSGVHTFVYQFGDVEIAEANMFMWRFNTDFFTEETKIFITDLGLYEGLVNPFE